MSDRLPDKLPGEAKLYGLDWYSESGPDGPRLAENETIVTSSWEASPSGLTISDQGHTDTVTRAMISGGTAAQDYAVTNTVTTSDGNTLVSCVHLYVPTC